ncbi:MAG: polysaccharide deacetylase family protein [Bryobacteraceae bacterium]
MTDLAQRVRLLLQQVWACCLHASGCMWWVKRRLRRRNAAVVLTFHRVLRDAEVRHTCSLPGIVVRERTFTQLAAYVAAEYSATGLKEVFAPARDGKLAVTFTFDDGWKDTYLNAVPVARRHAIPLTVFICPGLIGRDLPFWPERIAAALRNSFPPVADAEIERIIEVLKTQNSKERGKLITEMGASLASVSADTGDRTLSWIDVLEMDAAGIGFGCHTHTHQILTAVPEGTARQEIREGKRAIEAVLHKPCNQFAYPNGNCSRHTQQLLAEEGFTAAFTTHVGGWTQDTDPLAVPRVNICEANVTGLTGGFSRAMFQYTVFWKTWRAMRAARRVPAKPRPEPVLTQA